MGPKSPGKWLVQRVLKLEVASTGGINFPMVWSKRAHVIMFILGGNGGFGTKSGLPDNALVLPYPGKRSERCWEL